MSFIHFNGKLLKIDIELLTSFDIMLCVLWTRGKKADLEYLKKTFYNEIRYIVNVMLKIHLENIFKCLELQIYV